MNQTYSVLFWINRAKTNKTARVPSYASGTVSGKRAEIATGRYVESERWNVKEGNMKGHPVKCSLFPDGVLFYN